MKYCRNWLAIWCQVPGTIWNRVEGSDLETYIASTSILRYFVIFGILGTHCQYSYFSSKSDPILQQHQAVFFFWFLISIRRCSRISTNHRQLVRPPVDNLVGCHYSENLASRRFVSRFLITACAPTKALETPDSVSVVANGPAHSMPKTKLLISAQNGSSKKEFRAGS